MFLSEPFFFKAVQMSSKTNCKDFPTGTGRTVKGLKH
jgi:hypothetical protein